MSGITNNAPDAMIVRLPRFRAAASGFMPFEDLFDGGLRKWWEAHGRFFEPLIFDALDISYGRDGKAAWIWPLKDEAAPDDVRPYEIIEHPDMLLFAPVKLRDETEE